GEWQQADGLADQWAPQGDFLQYLRAARQVEQHGTETRAGIPFTRYTFELDGRALATQLRTTLEHRMGHRAQLPRGAQIQLPPEYSARTGNGELWVRPEGFPLRQLMHLHFPPGSDHTTSADIAVDFSGWPEGGGAAWSAGHLIGEWAL